MVRDNRSSRSPKSGTVEFASGDAGTSKDTVLLRDEETFAINDYTVSYSASGSTNARVEFYDDDSGTAEADLGEELDAIEVSPDSVESQTHIARDDISKDLVVVVRNNDDDVTITVGGYVITG